MGANQYYHNIVGANQILLVLTSTTSTTNTVSTNLPSLFFWKGTRILEYWALKAWNSGSLLVFGIFLKRDPDFGILGTESSEFQVPFGFWYFFEKGPGFWNIGHWKLGILGPFWFLGFFWKGTRILVYWALKAWNSGSLLVFGISLKRDPDFGILGTESSEFQVPFGFWDFFEKGPGFCNIGHWKLGILGPFWFLLFFWKGTRILEYWALKAWNSRSFLVFGNFLEKGPGICTTNQGLKSWQENQLASVWLWVCDIEGVMFGCVMSSVWCRVSECECVILSMRYWVCDVWLCDVESVVGLLVS